MSKAELSSRLTGEWVKVCTHYKQYREYFAKVYEQTCVYVGGKDWKNNAVETAEQVRQLVYPVVNKHGMTLATFNRYCRAANLCALTGLEFKMGHFSAKDVSRAIDRAKEDTSDKPQADKINKQFAQLMAERTNVARVKQVQKAAAVFCYKIEGESSTAFRNRLIEHLQVILTHADCAPKVKGWDLARILKGKNKIELKELEEEVA